MGEPKLDLKQNIELAFQQRLIEPLMYATGQNLLRRLPEKNPHLDKAEHSYMGFWGAHSVEMAFRDIPALTNNPENTLVISDMDGPFVKLRPSVKFNGPTALPEVNVFKIDRKQVNALESSHTPNIYASNRSIHFPETPQLVRELEGLGAQRDKIFLYQDKEAGIFRDKAEFKRLTELIKKMNPKQLLFIFDVYNWPLTMIQDIAGSSGHYLKDILHSMDIEQQREMAVGMIGVTPLLKDTIYVPSTQS